MNIPDEAVEALARILANESLFSADLAGYGWDSETDSSDHFMPSARKKARGYLDATGPILMAGAWEMGMVATKLQSLGVKPARNPYLTEVN